MQSKFLVGLIISFLIGIGWRTVSEVSLEAVIWILFMGLVVGLVGRRKSFAFSSSYLLSLSLVFVALALGIVRTEVASWQFDVSPLKEFVGEKVVITGVVTIEPDYRERTVQLYVKTETDRVMVSVDRLQSVRYGDKIQVEGKLDKPEEFETDLGRTFDYPGYLKVRGVEYRISFAEVEVLEPGLGNPIIAKLLQFKKSFITSTQNIIPEPAVGLGSGLLLGVKSALGDDIEDDFRRTGIIHIVVLSGYNVMLVVAFILFCLSFFLSHRWRVFVGVLAIIAFALIVGFSATVVRASIMAVLVLLSQVLGRRYSVVRALLLAGVVMILLNPYLLIYDIGFQLSFMATLGLVLIIPQFEARLLEQKSWYGIRDFLLSTIATQIAVLPLLMYHIGEVSLIAILVNVIVLPVVPFAMFLTFITGILGFVSIPLASIFGFAATLTLDYILYIAHFFANIPFAVVTVPAFSALGVFLFYLGMTAVWYFIQKSNNVTENLSGWVIEDEEKVDESLCDSPTKNEDLPVFFR